MTAQNSPSTAGNGGRASEHSTAGASSGSSMPPQRHEASVDEFWQNGAMRALHVLAESGRPFTVDELREPPFALPAPHHANAWGGLVQSVVRQGWLQRVGYVTSPAASRHGGVVSLWRGTRRVQGGGAQ